MHTGVCFSCLFALSPSDIASPSLPRTQKMIPPLNAQRTTAKSPKAIHDVLDVLQKFGCPAYFITPLKESELLAQMPIPELKYTTDETTGSCSVTGAAYLLGPSLERIGFLKNDQFVYTLCYSDQNTPETVPALLQKLCDLRGWTLTICAD